MTAPRRRHALDRRALLAALAGTAAAPLVPAFCVDAAPLAYTLSPAKLADGVWMLSGAQEAITAKNGGAIANIVILDTSEGAVIVDTGPSKRFGEAVAKLAVELTGKPVVRVYLTHIHPDHVFGNQAFAPATLCATAETARDLKLMGEGFADAMYRTVGDWMRGTELVLPGAVAREGAETIGSRKFRLLPLSGHTASDLAILDETSGILLAADLVFLDRAPTTPNADIPAWHRALETLRQIPHARLVPGHGPAESTPRAIDQTRDWLLLVDETIRSAFDRGLDITEAIALPLPAWTERIALARYEFERSVMHLFPKLEAGSLPRVDRKS